jgi:hypothetical protein
VIPKPSVRLTPKSPPLPVSAQKLSLPGKDEKSEDVVHVFAVFDGPGINEALNHVSFNATGESKAGAWFEDLPYHPDAKCSPSSTFQEV